MNSPCTGQKIITALGVSALLCIGAIFAPVHATTRHVPSEYPNIQAGIDAAVDGVDDVAIADGTYTGTGNHDIDFRGKRIVVHSENGPDACIVDGGGLGADQGGFVFRTGETTSSVLEGITIINCWKDMAYGGGIYIHQASPTIRNCVLMGNVADGLWGGGIYCSDSNAQIIGCVITGNGAGGYHEMGAGGGIYAESSSITLEGCTIAANMSRGPGSGGVTLAYGSTASCSRTIFWGNCGGYFRDFEGTATMTCCDTDLNGVDTYGIEFVGPQVHEDPLFCDLLPCSIPVVGGDYRLQPGSPCLPGSSPCGELIGALSAQAGGYGPIPRVAPCGSPFLAGDGLRFV